MHPAPVSLDEILHPARVAAAWEKLRANDGAAGEDSVTIRELEEALPRLWPSIEDAIRSGTYQPAPLRPVHIPKPSGGTRKLAIPSVIDRLVQHAACSALSSLWENRFPNCSFAYRPGTGAQHAINAVLASAAFLENPVALRIDIREFFDCIPRDVLAAVLRETPCDDVAAALIHRSLAAPLASPLGPASTSMGIPQGSPLSPLLSNAVLLPFDLSFSSSPASLFRYADDMLVLCRDERMAQTMLSHASHTLACIGLEFNSAKTLVGPLDTVSFLGFAFTRDGRQWVRDLAVETRESCLHHLRRMEDSGKSPAEMTAFLRQWTAYFLPRPEDRTRHALFLRETCGTFRLPEPEGKTRHRCSPPPGFSYSGHGSAKDAAYARLPWALRFLLRRIRFGLTFRRKGFLPVPSGIHITIGGHRIHFRL